MDIQELNVLLTRIGPGTPCGELMRRYWQPAALSEELPPGRAPVPVHLLGEDLVLFRDEQGRAGLLGLHCAHRGADLSYGRLEDGGLRCLYHGWLYDVTGQCLEQPGEPAGSTFKDRVRQRAYPCVERAGAIFAYLGPGEPPPLPPYDFLHAPDGHVAATKAWQECSYLQANEGNLDTSHLSYMHLVSARFHPRGLPGNDPIPRRGLAPGLETAEVELMPFGLRSAKLRRDFGPDAYELLTADFLLPNAAAFFLGPRGDTSSRFGYSVHYHVPIDDTRHWKYVFRYSRHEPFPADEPLWRYETERYRPVTSAANRYGQDRARMQWDSYTGMGPDFHEHDQWATETMGAIPSFAREHFGALDLAITVSRKLLVKAIEDVQQGRDPAGVVRAPSGQCFPVVPYCGPVPAGKPWRVFNRELEAEVYGQHA